MYFDKHKNRWRITCELHGPNCYAYLNTTVANPTLSNQNFDEWHSVMSTGDSTSGYRFQIDHSGSHELRFMGYMKVDITEEWLFFTYTKCFHYPQYLRFSPVQGRGQTR